MLAETYTIAANLTERHLCQAIYFYSSNPGLLVGAEGASQASHVVQQLRLVIRQP